MKLGELRSAIRNTKGDIFVEATLAGRTILIPIQKTKFVKDTLDAFGDNKASSTGLIFTDDGTIKSAGADGASAPPVEIYEANDDLEDLLG